MKIEQKHFDAMLEGTNCKFWDSEDEEKKEGILLCIDAMEGFPPFTANINGNLFYLRNCEPLETYVKK